MSVTQSSREAAIAAVKDTLGKLMPPAAAPFVGKELQENYARRFVDELERKGWQMVTDAEVSQLIGQVRESRERLERLVSGDHKR